MLSRVRALGGFLLAAILSVPAWGANSPLPGTINYIEGQAEIGASALKSSSAGSAELEAGQTLTTKNGNVELLLTPGVFLRVGDNSSLQMVSPSLANTQVRLDSGQAMVEVDEIHKSNDIRVLQDGASTQLMKKGLYDFDATQEQVRVFKGQAVVRDGDQKVKVGGGHELTLNATGKLKANKFDQKQAKTASLYRFSQLRSDYLADASASAAEQYAFNGWYGPAWYGPGWFWNPWFSGFTFLPGSGILYSPFGYGFYSPLYISQSPAYWYRGSLAHQPKLAMGHAPVVRPPASGFHAPMARMAAPMSHSVGGFGGGIHAGGAIRH